MTQSTTQNDPVLVWGGGAIGGTMAAYWARAGVPVLMVDVAADHVQACRTSGLRIEGPVDQFTQVVPSVTPDEVKGVFSRVVLAVKALATEQAVRQILPHLASDGVVLSAQNGLNELTIARLVGESRTLGCFVNFGADWLEPGRILFGSRGSVVVGEIAGPIRARTMAMHELLKVFEPDAVLTDNIWGYLWGKLGYLSMVYATALTNESMFDHFNDPARFHVFRRLGSETMAVAHAQGVQPIGFSGFEPAAFGAGASEDQARASMQALCAFRKKSAKSHSGIWRDIAVRKRRSEVDSQIGLIVQLGEQAGVATPMLALLARLIHEVEAQRLPQSLDTFMQLDTLCQSLTTSTAA